MAEEPRQESLRDRLGTRGEEVVGRIAQDLLDSPWFNSLVSTALEARGRAAQAQELALDLAGLPSSAQIDRLTRRVRSVAQRLESIEDAIARLEDRLREDASRLHAHLDEIERRVAPHTGSGSASTVSAPTASGSGSAPSDSGSAPSGSDPTPSDSGSAPSGSDPTPSESASASSE
jgi:TolA-binding protein